MSRHKSRFLSSYIVGSRGYAIIPLMCNEVSGVKDCFPYTGLGFYMYHFCPWLSFAHGWHPLDSIFIEPTHYRKMKMSKHFRT